MSKEITLKDLEEDEFFFNDLRDENFVLVLGAGFSFGVQNKNAESTTIPLAQQFIDFTNKKFKESLSGTIKDYSTAAEAWENRIESDANLFNEFKNLFLIDESQFNFKLFNSIFLPNWYSIFTFNFDNVLESLKDKFKINKYPIISYPTPQDSNENCLIQLHGNIANANTLNDIVFTSQSYINLGKAEHSLYDVLHGDVEANKKNIIIIGTQFKEDIVLAKFFHGINRAKIKIYHFDTETNISEKPQIKKTDYHFIKLEDEKGNKGTPLFLQFLQKNKHKIKNISLDGALTIDGGFIDTINNGEKFSKSKFYSAKQEDNCQWYGILNYFDIVRENYQNIKNEVLNAFSSVTTYKVVSIIHGTGGCGKSTLLRRLALELVHQSEFEIIWVKDRQLENFVLNALPKIQADFDNKYLVFVEDWYRLTDEHKEIGDTLLKNSQVISNIRLVIGDREINGKNYLLNLTKPENVFELNELENKSILEKIVTKHTDWNNALKLLVTQNLQIFNSPLFLILFAIAGVSENRFDKTDIDFTDLGNTVKRIAKYDLRKIAEYYPGFAKALHYWSCVYDKYKIFISYYTFLQVADFYNGNKDISTCFANWKSNSEVLDKLKLYINVSTNDTLAARFQKIDLVQFNHDKLAEDVLSKVTLEGWEVYDDIQKKKLLNRITNNGDDYSASVLLKKFLDFESQIFENDMERKSCIDKLFYEKKNRHFQYLTYLTKLNLNSTELISYIDLLAKESLYHPILWLNYFKIANNDEKQTAAKKILKHENFISLQPEIIVATFNQKRNEEEKQKAAKKILEHENILSLQHDIVVAAFNQKGNKEEKQKAAKKILEHENILSLQHDIVVAAFNQKGNKEEKQKAAKKILEHENILSLQHDIVVAAFNQKGNKEEKQKAAKKILKHENISSIIHHVLVAAFNQKGNEEEKQTAAKKILKHENIISLQPEIMVAAFNQKGNDDEKQTVAKKILEHENIISLQYHIVVAAFNQKGNDDEKQTAAKKILVTPQWKEGRILFSLLVALKIYSPINPLPLFVSKRIDEIVNTFNIRTSLKIERDFYFGLMKIPFHKNKLWQRESNYIIAHWNSIDRRAITNVLYSNMYYPHLIKATCEYILKNWKTEITQEIKQVYGKAHKGDHIKIAMGHPDLRQLAEKTANEIITTNSMNSIKIPDYLLEFSVQINNDSNFKPWNQE